MDEIIDSLLGILIDFVFDIVNKLYSTLLSPIISGIMALFPATSLYFGYISTFLNYAFTYVSWVLDVLCVPDNVIILLFDYALIKFAIYGIQLGVKLTIKVYELFKP